MIPYLILLFTVTTIAYAGRRNGSKGVQYLSVGIIVLLLTLFAGLRYRFVGTDTGNYVRMFLRTNSFSDIWQSTEIGYNVLMLLAKSLSDNYASILILIALTVVGCYISTIVRLTKRYETAIFIFITLGAYTFFFNGARQGIAAAICFLAIPWLLERKPKQYFLFVGLAFTFHHTALIAALLYFLAVPRIGWRQIAIIAGGSVVMTLFLATFVQLATVLVDDKYAAYAAEHEGGGYIMVTFLVAQGALLYFLRNKAKDSFGYYPQLLNIYLIGLIPLIAAVFSNVNPSGIIRLHMYFSTTAILLWPMVFLGISKSKQKIFISLCFLLFTLLFFYVTTSTFSNLVPYRINLEII